LADHEFQKERSSLENRSLVRPKLLQEVSRHNEVGCLADRRKSALLRKSPTCVEQGKEPLHSGNCAPYKIAVYPR